MNSSPRHEHPVSMRLPETDLAVIDRAAGLRGRSRTDFVREAALRAAEAVLLEQQLIRLSEAGFASFAAAIEAPGEAVPQLVEALRRAPPWDGAR
jgi:uncharacterized protein (DUF1778 family)